MITFIKLLSFIILSCWFVFVLFHISRGRRDTVLFVICVFYVFFGFPVLLDVIKGLPSYSTRAGFYLASRDDMTNIIYSFFIAFVPFFWWFTTPKSYEFEKKDKNNQIRTSLSRWVGRNRSFILPMLFFLLMSPILMWSLSPDPLSYLRYGDLNSRGFTETSTQFHVFVTYSIYASIMAGSFLFMIKNKNLVLFFIICLLPFLSISIWLSGKRFTLFLVIALFTYILFDKGLLKGKKLIIYVIFITVILGAYSSIYQTVYRTESYTESEIKYENFRIDYGRDDVTKLAIYAELDQDLNILEHRGQSFLFNSLFFIPRSIWEEKPYPYPKYMTSSMFLVDFKLWDWGVTTSIIDSAIADFGWLGFLVGPLFISIICRVGQRKNTVLANFLTTIVACMFLVLHLPAFAPMMLIWIIVIFFPKRKSELDFVTY